MKKSLLALAVAAALPAAAHAQSSVTLYGILDTGVEYLNAKASSSGVAGARLMDTNASWNGSRFGVRGVEPLGNSGMSAVFGIESRLGVDTGNTGGSNYTPISGSASTNTQFWNGLAFVGLRGSFGELTMGRQYTPAFYAWYFADTTANAGYHNWALVSSATFASTTKGNLSNYGSNASYGAVRADNSIMLNQTIGSLTIRAMAAMGEGSLNTGTSAASSGDLYALSGVWALNKQLTAYAFYNKQDSHYVAAVADANSMDTSYGIAGKYDTGSAGLTLGYSVNTLHSDAELSTILLSGYTKVSAAGTIYVNGNRVTVKNGNAAVVNGEQLNASLTYFHALSNRTGIYVSGSYSDITDYAKGTQTKVALGLNHKF